MRERFARRPAFHRPPVRDRVAERVLADGLTRVLGLIDVEVLVVGQALGVHEARASRKYRVAVGGPSQWLRCLQLQARHRLTELGGAEERAARCPGRHVRKGAAREWAEAVLANQRSAGREDPPLEKIATRDLAQRQRLDNLRPIIPGPLSFSLPDARSLAGDIHASSPTRPTGHSRLARPPPWPSVDSDPAMSLGWRTVR